MFPDPICPKELLEVERLHRCPCLGAVLNFAEDDDRLVRHDNRLVAEERRHHDDEVVHLQRAVENGNIVWIFKKVKINDMLIVFLCKPSLRKGLAALPLTFDNKRAFVRSILPFFQRAKRFNDNRCKQAPKSD